MSVTVFIEHTYNEINNKNNHHHHLY